MNLTHECGFCVGRVWHQLLRSETNQSSQCHGEFVLKEVLITLACKLWESDSIIEFKIPNYGFTVHNWAVFCVVVSMVGLLCSACLVVFFRGV